MTAAEAHHPRRASALAASWLLLGLAAAALARGALNGHAAPSAFAAGAGFGAAMLAMAWAAGWRPSWPAGRSLSIGAAGGLVLIAIPRLIHPLTSSAIGMRPEPWVAWVVVTCLVVIGEEAVLRGVIFEAIRRTAGAPAAVLVTAIAFALVHVPLYGWQVVPLDLGVGIWFAGLRLAGGGIGAPAIAHAMADLSTWWI